MILMIEPWFQMIMVDLNMHNYLRLWIIEKGRSLSIVFPSTLHSSVSTTVLCITQTKTFIWLNVYTFVVCNRAKIRLQSKRAEIHASPSVRSLVWVYECVSMTMSHMNLLHLQLYSLWLKSGFRQNKFFFCCCIAVWLILGYYLETILALSEYAFTYEIASNASCDCSWLNDR